MRLAVLVAVVHLVVAAPAFALPPIALFGTAEFRADSHEALPQWRRLLGGIAAEAPVYDACAADPAACPNRAMMAWMTLLAGLEGAPEAEQVRAINRFANQWRYATDIENFGRSDYWATPGEFLRRSGDCEDYAIFKYVSLRLLGLPAKRLRLVVLQDTLRDLAHAVLAVYGDKDVLILDNVTDAVLPHARLVQYVPYYSVNEDARWAHVPSNDLLMSAAGTGTTR